YPALDMPYHDRGLRFRESYAYIRNMAQERPDFENAFGRVGGGIDMLPQPTRSKLALLITGGSQQSPDWLARNGDGWITYPRNVAAQAQVVQDYRARLAVGGQPNKPVIQSLYIDLVENDDAPPKPIHLGFQSGAAFLCQYLSELRTLGINHVALNLRFNQSDPEQTLKRLAKDVLPGLNP
ncbi:MAG: LLM class flavin-dependent oxidoreductase, partial [Sedimentitalea sp.]